MQGSCLGSPLGAGAAAFGGGFSDWFEQTFLMYGYGEGGLKMGEFLYRSLEAHSQTSEIIYL
jgi:hypothetical protein